ncbi:hypothetical protein [Thermus thermamylovorans]|uniref:Bioflim formation protein n=1 Tax=Thermus thermamylovorans TaxID=2509362 RepID=A0A4Q9B5I9_9DEIN|nr:hypothetical protein [Thermus thermamylovorans]TBH21260.1 hypothetical protein ETP66_03870 [Thermus thermamylovorans]
MKRTWALAILLGLASGLAQGRLEAGAYGAPGTLFPTLEAALTLEGDEAFFRLQGGRGALGLASGVALGPLGYLGYGFQVELGEGGMGGVVFAEGGAGPFALQGRLGYRPRRAPPLFPEEGPFGRLSLRYRLAPREAVGLLLEGGEAARVEATYARRAGATYTLGAGLAGPPYLVLGYRGEVGEGMDVLDLALRLGGLNRLEAGLYLGEASLLLTLSYPFAGSLLLWLGDLGLEVGHREAPYAWVRYAWRWP